MNNLEMKEDFTMNADWERAERNAWSLNFDQILKGCLFHFGRFISLLTYILRLLFFGQEGTFSGQL